MMRHAPRSPPKMLWSTPAGPQETRAYHQISADSEPHRQILFWSLLLRGHALAPRASPGQACGAQGVTLQGAIQLISIDMPRPAISLGLY